MSDRDHRAGCDGGDMTQLPTIETTRLPRDGKRYLVGHHVNTDGTTDLTGESYWLVGRERCDTCHGAGTLDPSGNPGGPGCAPCSAGCLDGWTPTDGTIERRCALECPGDFDDDTLRPLPHSPNDRRVLVVPADEEG